MSSNKALTRWVSSTLAALLLLHTAGASAYLQGGAPPGIASEVTPRDRAERRRQLEHLKQLLQRSASEANLAVRIVRRGRKLLVKPLGPPHRSAAAFKRRVIIDGLLEIAAHRDERADTRGRFSTRARQRESARARATASNVRARRHARDARRDAGQRLAITLDGQRETGQSAAAQRARASSQRL